MDRFSLVKKIRETDQKTPILILSSKGLKEDKLEGFSLGADDYVTKPFAIEELLARRDCPTKKCDSANRRFHVFSSRREKGTEREQVFHC